jgi:hypothetical protein
VNEERAKGDRGHPQKSTLFNPQQGKDHKQDPKLRRQYGELADVGARVHRSRMCLGATQEER